MRKASILKMMIVFILCNIVYACGQNDNTPANTEPGVTENEMAVIICSVSELTFESGVASQSITFTTNKEWTLGVLGDISWCTLSAMEGGEGTANITINVNENTSYIERNATLGIRCGDVIHTIIVTQKQKDAILLSSSKYEMSQEGGTIDVNVKSNIDYELEIAFDAKGWIKESTSRSLTAHAHTFIISSNDSAEKREGEIYFKNGSQIETVKVYQEGTGSVLLLTQNEYTLSAAGETITVEIRSNVEYSIQMPDIDWIKVEENSRALSTHTLKYVIDANPLYEMRTAKIIFYDKNNPSLKETLLIIQKQKNALILGSNRLEIGQAGGNVIVEVKANIDYTVEVLDAYKDWVKENSSRSLVTHAHTFSIAANESYESRTAEVRFYDNTNRLSESLYIQQKQKDVISVLKDSYEVSSQENTIVIDVFSNIAYEVNVGSSWIKFKESKQDTGTDKLFFMIEENTGEARQTQITIINKENDIVKEIVVKQQKKAQESPKEDKEPEGKVEDMNWG